MHTKLLAAFLASAIVVPALAQDRPATRSDTVTTTTRTQGTLWRASKLVGLNVYNDQNEKLGDISEVLLDKSGKVEGVVIGVGGFLGIGQSDIKVEMSKLKFVDEPVRYYDVSNHGRYSDRRENHHYYQCASHHGSQRGPGLVPRSCGLERRHQRPA
jgi:sporulation protein YlmC with PRC-barrel domain